MRGAPARAIQELAGHQDLETTQRYMHLSPAALDAAIRMLDEPRIFRLKPEATGTQNTRPVWSWRNREAAGKSAQIR
jgi:hypothetical protein